jgi:cell division septal protein FtsQ
LEQRLERLIELLKILPQEKVAVVDLRYGKGAAIKWLSV